MSYFEPPRSEILAIYHRIEEAWGQGNSKAAAANFAPDGDLTDPFGNVARGRDQVEALLRQTFTQGFPGSSMKITPELIRSLSADVAISDGTWHLTLGAPPGASPPPTPVGRLTTVFRKLDGKWQIESDRPMLPAPMPGAPPS